MTFRYREDALGHVTRGSDSSIYDAVCMYCGATDENARSGLYFRCKATPEQKAELAWAFPSMRERVRADLNLEPKP